MPQSSNREFDIDPDEQKLCDLGHEIFDIMSNDTRRYLLRLISCEHNYGNQLAKILNVSAPTVHRHLKNLVDNDMLSVDETTVESYSGHRGGEAVLYNIDRGINLFMSVLPSLVHAHVIEIDEDGNIQPNPPKKKIDYHPTQGSDDENVKEYSKIAEKSQTLTTEILDLEIQLMEKLYEKNNLMSRVDELLASSALNYRQRIVLRAIACLGKGCLEDIVEILGVEEPMVDHFLSNLEDRGWIEKDTQ